jgi:hypothetical protein
VRRYLVAIAWTLTAASLILSANLWQQLRAERSRVAQLEQRELARVTSQSKSARATPEVEARQITPPRDLPQSASTVEVSGSAFARPPSAPGPYQLPPRESSERTYPDIAEELGLRPDETDALYGLLAHHADEAAFVQLLGQARYQLLQEYKKTLTARNQVQILKSYFVQEPLTKYQSKLYQEMVMEESERFKDAARRNSVSAASDPTYDLAGANMRATEERMSQEFERARGILTPTQFATLQKKREEAETKQKELEARRKAQNSQ